jgi:single-strand DNA-binding protein
MAEGLNRVTLIGNLGQDPELRFTQSNQAVMSLRMATTESYYDQQSKERKEITEWHTVIVWGKQAEALNKILKKGSRIYVEGGNRTRSWEDKQGNKRYSTEVKSSKLILLGGGPGRDQQDGGHDPVGNGGGGYEDHGQAGGAPVDEDLPF